LSPKNGFLSPTGGWLRSPTFGEYESGSDPVLDMVLSQH